MPAWITPAQAEERDPGFFERRGENGWTVDSENRRIGSRFGFAEVRVQIKGDGAPDFDRVVYGEAPNINAVVWGRHMDGMIRIAVTIQARPFSDNPDGTPTDTPIVFGQPCVMGFLDKIVGKDAFERGDDGAIREAQSEAGVGAVKNISEMGFHNPNPTFCATWSQLLEIEVDLDRITNNTDQAELIYRAEYLTIQEVCERIAEGERDGVCYRSATANNAFFTWLAQNYPLSG